ncbi:MAG TPA: TPM domain-containing protein [Thermoanaerobaculia bacterium]|nr:TPM domain-containing protein [Thermoanaerobaculia bacterium]
MRPFRFLFLLLAALPLFALDVPPAPDHYFTDRANLVTPQQASQLEQKLSQFEQQSGAQFIIYVLPSLEGDALEDFTVRAARQWAVGQKKYNNGLVLFVFAQEKKIRVEVGYGLEGSITDAFSSRVIRDVMAPRFQANDFFGGLNAAADAVIAKVTKGEEPVPPMQRPGGGAGQTSEINPIFVLAILFVVFFVLLPMLSRRGRRGGGGCGGCLPLMFFPGGGGGITFGGGGFSGGGGWGGGGGGFSGGGGSFGGGGASGGW